MSTFPQHEEMPRQTPEERMRVAKQRVVWARESTAAAKETLAQALDELKDAKRDMHIERHEG